jgi:tRNA(fMet)-specific endonuclease VapC
MSGKYLLDTNIAIALFAQERAIHQQLAGAVETFIPSIVIGELYYGAYKSVRVASNIERIDEFTASNTILEVDTATAKEYGQIKSGLRAKGRPIPENDIWIAAIAKQYGLTLVTRDKHFEEVEGLAIEIW